MSGQKEIMQNDRERIIGLIKAISDRPAMYVGTCSLRAVSHYLDGYFHALNDLGYRDDTWKGWSKCIELKFLICSPAWHWTRILLHTYGSNESSFSVLPDLFSEYLIKLEQVGLAGIEMEHDEKLRSASGSIFLEPKETSTKIFD